MDANPFRYRASVPSFRELLASINNTRIASQTSLRPIVGHFITSPIPSTPNPPPQHPFSTYSS